MTTMRDDDNASKADAGSGVTGSPTGAAGAELEGAEAGGLLGLMTGGPGLGQTGGAAAADALEGEAVKVGPGPDVDSDIGPSTLGGERVGASGGPAGTTQQAGVTSSAEDIGGTVGTTSDFSSGMAGGAPGATRGGYIPADVSGTDIDRTETNASDAMTGGATSGYGGGIIDPDATDADTGRS